MMFLKTVFLVIIFSCGAQSYRWCCKSAAELRKCEEFQTRFDGDGNRLFPFDCVLGRGTEDCMRRIKNGGAEVIDLDGGDLFRYRDLITIVAAEDSGFGDASYYAVSVVQRGMHPGLSLRNLHGYTSCHTGVGKTVGWNMPMGWLYKNGLDSNPFSASCAPGAMDPDYSDWVPGSNKAKWCQLCIGNGHGEHVCERDFDELYYSYDGALRCLNSGGGQVAFVKHSKVFNNDEDYELLCPDGTRANPSDWSDCTTGRVPAHAVVMRNDTRREDAETVLEYLQAAQASIDDFTTFGGKDLLWGSKTASFYPKVLVNSYEYLGRDYYCNVMALYNRGPTPDCVD